VVDVVAVTQDLEGNVFTSVTKGVQIEFSLDPAWIKATVSKGDDLEFQIFGFSGNGLSYNRYLNDGPESSNLNSKLSGVGLLSESQIKNLLVAVGEMIEVVNIENPALQLKPALKLLEDISKGVTKFLPQEPGNFSTSAPQTGVEASKNKVSTFVPATSKPSGPTLN